MLSVVWIWISFGFLVISIGIVNKDAKLTGLGALFVAIASSALVTRSIVRKKSPNIKYLEPVLIGIASGVWIIVGGLVYSDIRGIGAGIIFIAIATGILIGKYFHAQKVKI